MGYAVLVLEAAQEVRLLSGNGHEFHAVNILVGLDVLLTGPSDPHNADLQGCGLLIAHVSCLRFTSV
jgi:hypothetical protein